MCLWSLCQDARRRGMECVYGTKYFTDLFLLNSDRVELIRQCLEMKTKDLKDQS